VRKPALIETTETIECARRIEDGRSRRVEMIGGCAVSNPYVEMDTTGKCGQLCRPEMIGKCVVTDHEDTLEACTPLMIFVETIVVRGKGAAMSREETIGAVMTATKANDPGKTKTNESAHGTWKTKKCESDVDETVKTLETDDHTAVAGSKRKLVDQKDQKKKMPMARSANKDVASQGNAVERRLKAGKTVAKMAIETAAVKMGIESVNETEIRMKETWIGTVIAFVTTADHQEMIVGRLAMLVDLCVPIVDLSMTIADRLEMTVDLCVTNVGHRETTADHRETTADHRETTTDLQEMTGDRQETTAGPYVTIADLCVTPVARLVAIVDHLEMIADQCVTIAGHHQGHMVRDRTVLHHHKVIGTAHQRIWGIMAAAQITEAASHSGRTALLHTAISNRVGDAAVAVVKKHE
jgi:hypothetical protein